MHLSLKPSTYRLDLDKWIYEPQEEDLEGTKDEDLDFFLSPSKADAHRSLGQHGTKKRSKKEEKEDEEDMKKVGGAEVGGAEVGGAQGWDIVCRHNTGVMGYTLAL